MTVEKISNQYFVELTTAIRKLISVLRISRWVTIERRKFARLCYDAHVSAVRGLACSVRNARPSLCCGWLSQCCKCTYYTGPRTLWLDAGMLACVAPSTRVCTLSRQTVEFSVGTGLHASVIETRILTGRHTGDEVFIARITLTPSDTTLPFDLKRRRFPIRPASAMTVNKSQGQTLDYVGLDLTKPCFTHGQRYVAFSRVRSLSSQSFTSPPNTSQQVLIVTTGVNHQWFVNMHIWNKATWIVISFLVVAPVFRVF